MSLVKFATKCDICSERSLEYTMWPSCYICGRDICMNCMNRETLDVDEGFMKCVCKECEE